MPELKKTDGRDQGIPETPKYLRCFLFHGCELRRWREGDEQVMGVCPFCSADGKFGVETATGRWQCFVCGRSGNPVSFLRQLWEASAEGTEEGSYESLAADRRLLRPETLREWGVVRSLTTGEWLVPGYTQAGKLAQLYSYETPDGGKKPILKATAGMNHQMFMPMGGEGAYLDPRKKETWCCEGPWDAMAVWELLGQGKRVEGGLRPTSTREVSLLSEVDVVGIPGANVFAEAWAGGPLFAGRRVTLFPDSDHSRLRCAPCKKTWSAVRTTGGIHENACPVCHGVLSGPVVDGAGVAGARRTVDLFSRSESPPAEIAYLRWHGKDAEEGYDPKLKSGYDCRDYLTDPSAWTGGRFGYADEGDGAASLSGRLARLECLLQKLEPTPAGWVRGGRRRGSAEVELTPCDDWATLVNYWRQALDWIDGLDLALSVMFASVISTKTVGSPLWFMIISPPSSGKTTLAEALAVARKYVYCVSELTSVHSGYKSDKEGTEDHGMIPKIKDKTFIIKDGDTLRNNPARDRILAQLRDLYDCTSRVHYGHGVSRDYDDVRVTFLLCGTDSLRELDGSELGERFLSCRIMDGIDEEFERGVARRVFHRAVSSVKVEVDGKPETRQTPEMVAARAATGGYVEYLRENAAELLGQVEVPADVEDRIIDLGTFVAYMRARPSRKQEEAESREFIARLVEQHARLAVCLAAVLCRRTVDDEVMRRVRKVSLDSSKGRTLDLCRLLHRVGRTGAGLTALANGTGHGEEKEEKLLRFLRRLKAVEYFRPDGDKGGLSSHPRWRLSPGMQRLFDAVLGLGGV